MGPTPAPDVQKTPTGKPPFAEDVSAWMTFQIAARIRRSRTRRELFRVSERDLDRMGLTRFDIDN